ALAVRLLPSAELMPSITRLLPVLTSACVALAIDTLLPMTVRALKPAPLRSTEMPPGCLGVLRVEVLPFRPWTRPITSWVLALSTRSAQAVTVREAAGLLPGVPGVGVAA